MAMNEERLLHFTNMCPNFTIFTVHRIDYVLNGKPRPLADTLSEEMTSYRPNSYLVKADWFFTR